MNLPSLRKTIPPFFEFWLIILFLFVSIQLVSVPAENNPKQFIGEVQGFNSLPPTPAPFPFYKNIFPMPDLSAKAAIITDLNSKVILYEKNADERLLPASTTKIMAALIVLENYPLDQTITFDGEKVEGNLINLRAGETMTIKNLLYGMLVGSGNDAAYTLANNFPGGIPSFILAMNSRAEALKMKNTHFVNPMGFDQENHYSSARDLQILAAGVLKNPIFAEIVSTPEIIISDNSSLIVHKLKNTNELVGKLDGVKGVKTGWTENAGECLVTYFEKDGRRILSVILGSKDRLTETEEVLKWVNENFVWKPLIPQLSYR